MHTVILNGDDLQYFAGIVRDGLAGNFGYVEAVQLYVQDDGRVLLGTNGMLSEPFGRPNAPLGESDSNTVDESTQRWYRDPHDLSANANGTQNVPDPSDHPFHQKPEGSGNPYANVPLVE